MTKTMAEKNEPLNPLYMASAHGSLQEKLAQEMAQAKSGDRTGETPPGSVGNSPAKKAPLMRGNHPPVAAAPGALHQQTEQPQRQVPMQHQPSPQYQGAAQKAPGQRQQPGPQQMSPSKGAPYQQQQQLLPDQEQGAGMSGGSTASESEKSSPTESEGSNTSTRQNRILQKRISHYAEEKGGEIICPRVNCPEKIIICLDLSDEMEKVSFRSRAGDKFAPIKLIKRALGIYMNSKQRINCKHEFALMFLRDQALWMCDFTTDLTKIMTLLDDQVNTFTSESFDMASVFEEILRHVRMPRVPDPRVFPPPYIVRLLFIYGRSHCVPHFSSTEAQKQLYLSPHFFIDAYYIHETPSEDNKCETIFDMLCELDEDGLSYVYEVAKNPTKLYDFMAQLLPHPLQRPPQKELSHEIEPRAGDALQG